MGQQRIDAPTAAGGAYSVALLDDRTGRVVEVSEHAVDGTVLAVHSVTRTIHPVGEVAGAG